MNRSVTVIGGGLAGCEAAWQIARLGEKVRLYEMRPVRQTPAHRTDQLAEIVCSNSLKSDQPYNASWLLKEELRRLGSILIRIADSVRVPAGSALAVDRDRFAARVTEVISSEPNIELIREEIPKIPDDGIVVIASGPLTSESLSQSIREFCGLDHLYFYDAISPIVDADTIVPEHAVARILKLHEHERRCLVLYRLASREPGLRAWVIIWDFPEQPVVCRR